MNGKKKNGKKRRAISLYQRFALAMIAVGIIPMLIVSTVLLTRMRAEFTESLSDNYNSAAGYQASSLDNLLGNYDTATKLLYSYGTGDERYSAYVSDSVRSILSGENFDYDSREEEISSAMRQFLATVAAVNSDIFAAHFVCDSEEIGTADYHYSPYSTYLEDEDLFLQEVGYENLDRDSRTLMIIAPHDTDYFFMTSGKRVFSVARNYYDTRGAVGHEKYVGTLYLDIYYDRLTYLFQSMQLRGADGVVMTDSSGTCLYATDSSLVGQDLSGTSELLSGSGDIQVYTGNTSEYGCTVRILINTRDAFSQISSLQTLTYILLTVSILLLLLAAILFSRQITRPIRRMTASIAQVGQGNFDLNLPVERNDEIGVLSESFNEMSRELKKTINQSYVARIRQTEAELTALRSQIYPHFLYNTLEIIRMTAVESGDTQVSDMLEALSEQIHYLIGPVGDRVPLSRELDIVRKYVYLLNCRIQGKVILEINAPGAENIEVPRLILQPIAENAYVHGIRPKKGSGVIHIDALRQGEDLAISVMDNGAGMDAEVLGRLSRLLQGDQPGIKNKDNWQSIGLKNVHDRVRFLYGEQYGISVSSTPGIGTIVELRMPYRTIGEQEIENSAGAGEGTRTAETPAPDAAGKGTHETDTAASRKEPAAGKQMKNGETEG